MTKALLSDFSGWYIVWRIEEKIINLKTKRYEHRKI